MDSNSNKIRTGFRYRHEIYLKKYDNPGADPEIQIFSNEEDDQEPEARQYWFTVCRSRLQYHKYLDIYICSECYEQYDTKIQDTPIANNSTYKLIPCPDIWRYPKYDEDNPGVPYIEGISLDEEQEIENNVILIQNLAAQVNDITKQSKFLG